MTDEHKAALAEGRSESRAVKKYLEALEENKPRRGRRRTKEGIEKRLAQIEADLPTSNPLNRVKLIQERMDLTNELNASDEPVDLSGLEAEFVKNAKGYSDRKGISYAAWRELGVAPSLLKQAGITRGS
ncbi:MAG TPA: hypothetical protein VFN21_06120 [Acidimicrobiales bacterium]|nr:hypothetical protein [Acidimicrobiales bacterium]